MTHTVQKDTGLTEHQQRERATVAKLWAWRLLDLMNVTGCTARDAVRAVEDADREARRAESR